MKIRRSVFSDIINENYKNRPDLKCLDKIEELRCNEYEESEKKAVINKIRIFVKQFKRRFENPRVSRRKDLLKKFYNDWLNIEEDFTIRKTSNSNAKIGRPEKNFEDLKIRQQHHVVSEQLKILPRKSSTMILKLAERCARSEGNIMVASSVKTLRTSLTNNSEKFSKIKPEKSLSLLLNHKFTVEQYNAVKICAFDSGYDIFPGYWSVYNAKKECRPDNIFYSELKCEVSLQNLLNHCAKRAVEIIKEDLKKEMNEKKLSVVRFKAVHNAGFDGASNQSNYNQKFESENVPETRDSHVFMTTVTPLGMKSKDVEVNWMNKFPHSPRSVRPKCIEFVKVSFNFLSKYFGEKNFILN